MRSGMGRMEIPLTLWEMDCVEDEDPLLAIRDAFKEDFL